MTIAQLQDGWRRADTPPGELVELYLESHRARSIAAGPALRSIIEINPDALTIADALDAERKSEGLRAARCTASRSHQGQHRHRRSDDDHGRFAGARGIDRRHATRSSSTQLRAAGAVILGKTNLSEWANFRSTQIDQRMERARRSGEEPVRPRPQPVRLELRHRRRDRREPRRRWRRHGDGRLDRLSVGREWARRDQADGRPGQPDGHHPDLAHAGHGGPDGAHGGRRGGAARTG